MGILTHITSWFPHSSMMCKRLFQFNTTHTKLQLQFQDGNNSVDNVLYDKFMNENGVKAAVIGIGPLKQLPYFGALHSLGSKIR